MIDKLTDQSASRRRSASGAFYFPTLERVETHNTNGRSIITNIIITTLDLQRSTVEERRSRIGHWLHINTGVKASDPLEMAGILVWFWNERFWLPHNVTWADLKNTDESTFPQAEDLYLACPLAFCMFMIRLVFERYVQCHIFIITTIITTSIIIIITAEDVALRASSSADDDDDDGTVLCSFTLSLNPCMN